MGTIFRYRIIVITLVLMSMVAIDFSGEGVFAGVKIERSSMIEIDSNSSDKADGLLTLELTPECGTSNCVYFPIIVKSGIDTFSGLGIVLEAGPSGSWDDRAVGGPKILHDGTQYLMWYSGLNEENNNRQIGYATSPDGINWSKHLQNPVLTVGEPGSWDENWVWAPEVLFDGSIWKMWYTGSSNVSGYQIGYATSADGIDWVKHENNPIFTDDPEFPWEMSSATSPYVMLNQGVYHMWYSKAPYGPLKYATSPDGISWTKYEGNPVLGGGPGNEYCDPVDYVSPTIIQLLGDFHMWVQSNQTCRGVGTESLISHYVSSDGINWVWEGKQGLGILNFGFTYYPTVNTDYDKVRMWYVKSGNILHAAADIIP